jgi:hypothetical protein
MSCNSLDLGYSGRRMCRRWLTAESGNKELSAKVKEHEKILEDIRICADNGPTHHSQIECVKELLRKLKQPPIGTSKI